MIRRTKIFHSILTAVLLLIIIELAPSYQQHSNEIIPPNIKTQPFYLDLYHKFGFDTEFKPRATILVRPKSQIGPAQASFVEQHELGPEDLAKFRQAYERDDLYFLKTIHRAKGQKLATKTTQTILKACSLFVTNLTDTLSINLSPLNEFLSVNLYTSEPECLTGPPTLLSTNKFNTTLSIESSRVGPQPDTATYIKRLEEERLNKLKEGKEDNRSFFAKYWIYIVPAVIILMMMSGPEAQGAR